MDPKAVLESFKERKSSHSARNRITLACGVVTALTELSGPQAFIKHTLCCITSLC